jgi:Ca2+-binding RTX toxin-like protein
LTTGRRGHCNVILTIARFSVVVAAAVATLVAAGPAHAIVISREGTEIVVRPDPGEPLTEFDIVASADRSLLTVHKYPVAGDEVESHTGPGCDELGSSCDVDDATALRVELGAGNQNALIIGSPLPVIVDGGPGNDRLKVRGGPTMAVAGGDGNDTITLEAFTPPGGYGQDGAEGELHDPATTATAADGGAGNDTLISDVAGARLTGGDGDDTLDATAATTQTLDCGAGADTVMVGNKDTVGAGCGPAVNSLRTPSTLATLRADGMLRVPVLARVRSSVFARFTLTRGKSKYAESSEHLRAGQAVATDMRPRADVKARLTKKLNGADLLVELFAGTRARGDRTVLSLEGSLQG